MAGTLLQSMFGSVGHGGAGGGIGDVMGAGMGLTGQPAGRLPLRIPPSTPEDMADEMRKKRQMEINSDSSRSTALMMGMGSSLAGADSTGKLLSSGSLLG